MEPVLIISITTIVPAMVGSVTYHIRCIRVAPSIIAASYSDESMPEIAAMYTIVPQPAPFHMSVITIIGRNMLDVVRNGIFSPPIWTIRLLTMPVLVDAPHDEWPGLHVGRVWFQAPEVDGITYVSGLGVAPGALVQGDIVESSTYDLTALA